jgi:hypothetical protein
MRFGWEYAQRDRPYGMFLPGGAQHAHADTAGMLCESSSGSVAFMAARGPFCDAASAVGRKRGQRTERMTRSCRTTQLLAGLALVVLAAASARADLSASYDGSLTLAGTGVTVAVALDQANVSVTGTLAIDSGARDAAGVYYVTGRVRGGKVILNGRKRRRHALSLARPPRRRRQPQGKAVMRGPGGKIAGTLLLVRRTVEPPVNPPVTCDNSFFTGQVMGRVLQPTCAACHVAGGAAQSTGFRVTPSDPIATQQSIDAFINRTNPSRVAHPAEAARPDPARRRPAAEPRQRDRADPVAVGDAGGDRPAVQRAARVAARAHGARRAARACLHGRAWQASRARRARLGREQSRQLCGVRRHLPRERASSSSA